MKLCYKITIVIYMFNAIAIIIFNGLGVDIVFCSSGHRCSSIVESFLQVV